MRHPSEADLALYAGGDLGGLERWRIAVHLRTCPHCRAEAALYRAARTGLARSGPAMPDEIRWERLASEMKANIRLGLDAGECIAASDPRQRPTGEWRPALALACLILLVFTGWLIYAPKSRPRAPLLVEQQLLDDDGYILESTSVGIELKEGERGFTLLNSNVEGVTYLVNTQGGVRARYIDADSGQVTINNVFAE